MTMKRKILLDKNKSVIKKIKEDKYSREEQKKLQEKLKIVEENYCR